MSQPLNFLLVGVGGQGTIVASDILAHVGLAAGAQVKQAEVHGMSQRGGSVISTVRWGPVVYSPLVGAGEVDVLVAFERLEALRYLNQLDKDGLTLINLATILPVTVTSLGQRYPTEDEYRSAVAHLAVSPVYVDGPGIAQGLGDMRIVNTIVLGALSALLERRAAHEPEPAPPADLWLEVIARRVPPRYVDLNRRAFLAGRSAISVPA